MRLFHDGAVFEHAAPAAIATLTERATAATFYQDGLSAEQIAANRRIVDISAPSALKAARHEHQRLSAAFVDGALAGHVIATRHGDDDLELDWLMLDPAWHGHGVAGGLMQAGIDWLGPDRPLWLNVIRYNARAIGFYRKFGFEIDPAAEASHLVPRVIMRRPAAGKPERSD